MNYYAIVSSDGYNLAMINAFNNTSEWNFLSSYAYRDNLHGFDRILTYIKTGDYPYKSAGMLSEEGLKLLRETSRRKAPQNIRVRLMIDSGAFTAYTTGKAIDLHEYSDYCSVIMEKYKGIDSLNFISLDVIGDQKKSDENFFRLRELGIPVLPVLTYGADERTIRRTIEKDSYICLGGLVGKRDKQIIPWVSRVFKIALESRLVKFHMLGISRRTLLSIFPVYSSDSSSWLHSFHGRSDFFGKIGTISEDGRMAARARIISIYRETLDLLDMVKAVTDLWAERGVVWD